MRAAYSGPLTDDARFARFNDWFTRYHAAQPCALYPRDFMWYNERIGAQAWFYALPENEDERGLDGFEVRTLPHGLFAVASCLDADLDGAADWMQTRAALLAWAQESNRFMPYENGEGKPERYPMFHIVSPERLIPEGVSVEDLYLPIEERKRAGRDQPRPGAQSRGE